MNSYKKVLFITFLTISIGLLSACKEEGVIFEDNESIKEGKWAVEKPLKLNFEITDTSKAYNLYYNIRNELSYPYYNVYVTYYLHYPDGKKVDSLLQDIVLFHPNTGEPYGMGTGGIREHQLPVFQNFKFKQKGKYTYEFKQFMRVNPLKGILSMGLRIEDAQGEANKK